MVVPRLNSKNRGSYLDTGPSQEQIERRSIIKHKLRLDMDENDSDALAEEPDYLEQISSAPSTPSSSHNRRFRSMSPGNLQRLQRPLGRGPLRRSKSDDLDNLMTSGHSNSSRSSRATTASNVRRNCSMGSTPKRSSSFGSFSGFSDSKKSQAPPSSPRSGDRRKKSEDDLPSTQQIICLGKSYRCKLSLDDAEEDDDIVSDEEVPRKPLRRTRTSSPSDARAPPRRSKSLGSNLKTSFTVNLRGGSKKFPSLLKSKKEKQLQHVSSDPVPKTPSASRRMTNLERSHSGDGHQLRRIVTPSRTSSWDGQGWEDERSPSFRERRNGMVPGSSYPFMRSPSTHRSRPKFPSLDKDPSETDDTVSMDSSSFTSRPSSASSREEIFNNAVRRAAERQALKQQHLDCEDLKSPSKSKRTSLLRNIQTASIGSPLFHKRGDQPHEHKACPAPSPRASHTSSTSWSKDQDDDFDRSDDDSSKEVASAPAGPSIFERGLKALEQIYDDLNA